MKRTVALSLVLGLLTLLTLGTVDAWADCGGNPCNCGDTVTSDHTLPGDLTCVGNGLTVAAGIILDLGGNDLTGTNKAGFGVQLNDSAQVKNGRVQNFNVGIKSVGASIASCIVGDDALVSPTSLVVTINRTGIELSASNCKILKTTLVANSGNGVTLAGNGNALTQLTCSRNGADGLAVVGNNNAIENNRCELNTSDGIFVNGSGNILNRNLAGRNGGSGVLAVGGGNSFTRNQGRTNGGDGVRGVRPILADPLSTDGRNYGTANDDTNCLIDGFTPTGGGRYC